MSARDDWQRIPFSARRRLLDALASPTVRYAVAEVLDPPRPDSMTGSEMTHAEERDLDAALALLEDA